MYQKYIYYSTEKNYQIYKIPEKKLRTLIRKAEEDYHKKSFNHKTQSMKQMWRELGNLLNTNKKKSNNSISRIIIDKVHSLSRLVKLTRKAEADYYKESFNHKTQSMKQMWRELGNLLNTSKTKSNNSISRVTVNNKILNNDKDITNALSTHFTQIHK